MVSRRLLTPLVASLLIAAVMLLAAHGSSASSGGDEDKDKDQGQTEAVALPEKAELKYPNLGSGLDRLVTGIEEGLTTAESAAAQSPAHREQSVAVTIYLSGNVDEVVSFLKVNGGDPRNVGEDYVEAYVPVTLLGPVSEQPGVLRVREIIPAEPAQSVQRVAGHGPAAHLSAAWNLAGYTGKGVKVGIIDTGFEGFGGLMGTELPSTVVARCYTELGTFTTNLADCEDDEEESDDHGTLVAEAVLDIAPQVSLYIANPVSQGDLQETARWMTSQGVSVINRSASYPDFDGPGDGTWHFSLSPLMTIDQTVANGSIWVNSAGNYARRTWFRDSPAIHRLGSTDLIAFDGSDDISSDLRGLGENVTVSLRWDDRWGGASRDLDLLLWDTIREEYVERSEDFQTGQDDHIPMELLRYQLVEDRLYEIVVIHRSGTAPDWVQVVVRGVSSIEHYTRSGSVNNASESANPGLLAVGAAHWDDVRAIEPYSSRGPTPDGRIKPDIVGAACGATALRPLNEYNEGGFCGTSQAAPHVAGLAALVRQRFPSYTPAQVADYLKNNAAQREMPDPNNTWGHGFAQLPPPDGTQPPALAPSKAFTRNPAADVDTLRAAFNFAPRGIWSDGTTMWVADSLDDKIYAYDAVTKARLPGREFDTLSAAGNVSPRGIWSDGTTMWVADSLDGKIYAYDMATRARVPGRDFDTLSAAGNVSPHGIWSDGTTMWVADSLDDKIYAYDAVTEARVPGRDFDTLRAARNTLPRGIWSDGTTMWVADWFREKVYAYDVATRGRVSGREFNTLEAAGNWGPQGIWSDGTTMWVADWLDGKVYAYSMPKESAADKEALIAFYNATGGAGWTNNANWLSEAHIGQWHGVTTDDDGRVTKLDLSYNELTGEIPSELGSLANLEVLVLGENRLTGPVPTWLGSLANLEVLGLWVNELSGEIPSELGSLANLQQLSLGGNRLTGEVPSELRSLANLEVLYLDDNKLSGEIPSELRNLANLRELALDGNQLTGPVPTWLGSLANLEVLHLWANELSGEIPSELRNLANLRELELGVNQLTGPVPTWLGSLANLERLWLDGNELSGEIPSELRNLANLRELGLSENQLTGPVPTWLGSLANLERLWLGDNQLTGEIPEQLGNLANLEWLYLGGNQLTGEVPEQLGNLANLRELVLGENRLTGPVPTWLGSLANLEQLDLGGNELSGEIPEQLGNLANLEVLYLNGNRLSGEIPEQLGNLANLGELELGVNQLSGEIPEQLGSLANLRELALSENQLTGPVPTWLGSLANLEWLHLGGNQLTGEIPEQLGNLANLQYLYLNGNQLSGEIPEHLGNLANLRGLVLSENQLTGPVPTWLGSLANLEWLYLSRNELTGGITSELGDLANLTHLYLNGNELTGEIPSGLGSLANLTHLYLWGNELTGELPQALTGLTVLEEFRFYFNPGLCAPVDDAFQTWLQGIAGVHGSSCALADSQEDRAVLVELHNDTDGGNWADRTNWLSERPIREWYGVTNDADGRVTGLYLWENQLKGEMPASLGSLTNLEVLILDGNELSGEIPAELGSLANLRELRLRGNRLTGCVPAGLREVLDDDFDELGLPLCGLSVTVTLTAASSMVRLGAPVSVTATFSNHVSGFTVDDVTVANGAADNFSGTGAVYAFDVTPNAVGPVTVDVAAGVALDAEGKANTSALRLGLGIPYDDDDDGTIGRSEVIRAITDYLFGDGSVARRHVIRLINLYLFGP